MQMKHETPIAELCSGLPVEFQTFLAYSRNLSFNEQPNYHFLRTLFHNSFSPVAIVMICYSIGTTRLALHCRIETDFLSLHYRCNKSLYMGWRRCLVGQLRIYLFLYISIRVIVIVLLVVCYCCTSYDTLIGYIEN